jgi:hypothetical protein
MLGGIKRATQGFVGLFGYQLSKLHPKSSDSAPIEMNDEDIELVQWVHGENLSMVSLAGLFSTVAAAKYVAENKIQGDFVECGVWRGGQLDNCSGDFQEIFAEHKSLSIRHI